MKKSTLLIVATLVLLLVFPVWWVKAPAPGTPGEVFGGTDGQAQDMILTLAPDYRAWFQPVLEPASGEIASLLFALQAALGAGVIGYWLGASVSRERQRQAAQASPPSSPVASRAD